MRTWRGSTILWAAVGLALGAWAGVAPAVEYVIIRKVKKGQPA